MVPSMKTILIMRHAKSSWTSHDLPDHDRPLNSRGTRDAPIMGGLIQKHARVPEWIICSTAERARQTAVAVAESIDFSGDIEYLNQLYLAPPAMCIEIIHQTPPDSMVLLLIGHNPGIESFYETLVGTYERFPTATTAQVELPIHTWTQFNESTPGKQLSLWRPKDFK